MPVRFETNTFFYFHCIKKYTLLGDYLLSCSLDQHWAFSDIRTGRVLTKCVSDVSATQGECQQPCVSIAIKVF
jgi:hypothetical protein